MEKLIFIPIILAIVNLIFVAFLISKIKKVDEGSDKIKKIALYIRDGAKAFLLRELKSISFAFIVIAVVLFFIQDNGLVGSLLFVFGGITSLLSGYIGMMVSTMANSRTAHSAEKNFSDSFKVAIQGGQVMGFLVVGLGLLGVSVAWLIIGETTILINYAFGASLIALYMRVGGGIFTKSADVGADLVGKTELDIPEDDPRNPAVIADNVGDNVGDIAGMGADLFESYVSTIIAAAIIGFLSYESKGVILPLLIAAVGILSSLLGSFSMNLSRKEAVGFEEQTESVRKAMERGTVFAGIFMTIGSFIVVNYYFQEINLFFAILTGLLCGFVIGKTTEYYTSDRKKPTLSVANASSNGPSGVIMEGLVVGMRSTVIPVLSVGVTIVLSYHLAGIYGIALSSLGILGVLGLNLSTDCYGPIADNAAGISEMAGLDHKVRERAEALDAVGNSTAAAGKGFAIGSAALASLAWLVTYSEQSGLSSINIIEPKILTGVFIGAMLPFLFSALTMKAVGRGALEIVSEVRRQFKEKSLMDGKDEPDSKACVDLATKRAIKEMGLPAIIVVLAPILIGFILGPGALAGMIVGSLSCGFLLALVMANSGASWDNAKKHIEAGNLGGKGSDAHKAAVVGDTIGDPFKDTSGPSLNILIKLISIVSLIILPLII
jgi:K(+)-stimulated pyrophosphate-energized sodium pump